MIVVGIYQDITNGGKTAKAHTSLGINEDAVLWYIVSIDVADGVDVKQVMDYYENAYSSAQVNDIKDYSRQTLGNLIDQLEGIVIGAIAVALIVVVLITALFLKMLLAKDLSQIAIMRSLGLTLQQIKNQYMVGILMVLLIGIVFGVFTAQFLGEYLVTLAMSFMGAAKMELIQVVWHTWLLCPLGFLIVVGFTISVCCRVTVEEDLSPALKS